MKIIIFLFIFILSSCTNSDNSNDSFTVASDSKFQVIGEYQTTTSNTGINTVSFPISSGTKAFQLITTMDGQAIKVVKLTSPNQEIIFNADTYYSSYLTEGKAYQKNINVFNFPTIPNSTELESGTYTITYQIESQKSDVSANTILIIKEDSDLSIGVININVIFAGSVANSSEIITAVKKAITDYTIPTLKKSGIKPSMNYISYPSLTSILPNPQTGDAVYENVSNKLPAGINLFIGSSIKDFQPYKGQSGLSASVPGAVLPCKKSAIAFSISNAVGDDGEFNGDGYDDVDDEEKETDEGDEIRLFSDSISHEIFHYLGLRNSVEFSSNTVVWSDGLNSEKCVEKHRCEQLKNTRENVMYPYPIKHDSNSDDRNYYWYTRNIVSSEQRSLANFWVGLN